jgi:hypothetical protein
MSSALRMNAVMAARTPDAGDDAAYSHLAPAHKLAAVSRLVGAFEQVAQPELVVDAVTAGSSATPGRTARSRPNLEPKPERFLRTANAGQAKIPAQSQGWESGGGGNRTARARKAWEKEVGFART